MTDVSGAALHPALDRAVRDDARADTGADLDEDEIIDSAGTSFRSLAEGHDVDVVVDLNRHTEAIGKPLAHGVGVPAGHDRGSDWSPGLELDGTWETHTDTPGHTPRLSRYRPHIVEELLYVAEDDLRSSANIGVFRYMRDDAPVQISDGNINTCRSKISDEHVPSVSIELNLLRGTPSAACIPPRINHKSGAL